MTNIYPAIDATIGNTPLVRLSSLAPEGVTILAKVEAFNPGGSVKDRIGKYIIAAAEKSGALPPGGTIVEATSGNTGIALALIGAARGYRVVIAMPASMSKERRSLLRALGAELVLTEPAEGMRGAVAAAEKIVAENEGAILASQFTNPANREAHYETTGPEIWRDTDGQVDYLISGIGTGGTISGAGAYLKEQGEVTLVAVEPAESPLLTGGQAGPHLIQGLGANFIPEVLDREIVDEVIDVRGEDALETARRAAREEGLLVGISSGAALAAALEVAARPEAQGKTIVAVLPDTGERYLSTALFAEPEE